MDRIFPLRAANLQLREYPSMPPARWMLTGGRARIGSCMLFGDWSYGDRLAFASAGATFTTPAARSAVSHA